MATGPDEAQEAQAQEAQAQETKGAQTRRAILSAAVARFGRDGYRATSVADIARDANVGGTQYWAANVTEYGVGAATGLPPIELTETAPAAIQDADIQTWLGGKLNGNDPLWPAADANTVYVLHYPESTTITLQGSTSSYSFTTTGFSSSATSYFAFYAPAGSGYCVFAYLTITSNPLGTPPPAPTGLTASLLASICGRR